MKKVMSLIILMIITGCSKDDDDCTKKQTLYGGYGPYGRMPDQTIVVPCDFPDPEPIREL